MRKFQTSALGVVLLAGLVLPGTAGAQAARDRLLIQPDEIDLNDRALVLLHVGDTAGYREAHLPGARLVQLAEIAAPRTEGGLALQMPEPGALKTALEALGISDDSNIVVYMGRDWVTPTTRVIYTLNWAGLGGRTRMLDGGLPAWQAAGRPVTAEVVAARTGRLSALDARTDLIVDREWMSAHRGDAGFAVVDARARAVYDGVQADQGRNGHIPGAGSLPWVELYDGTTAKLKSADEVRALFEQAGVKPGDTVVGYCHIGQYATAVLFAARSLGYDVRLYDGSFQDWARDPASPVEATRGSRP